MAEEERQAEIWVFVERRQGEVADVAWELLGKARELAPSLSAVTAALVLGTENEDIIKEAAAYGADKVYVFDSPSLRDYRTKPYRQALVAAARRHQPEIILLGATVTGRDLAGAVATHLRTGLTADCTSLEIDDDTKLLKQTRPAFGGNVMATIVCKDKRPQMATVRPRVFRKPAPAPGNEVEVIAEPFNFTESEADTEVIEFIADNQVDSVRLDKADIIVSVGRGIGSRENIKMVEELASVLKADIGASRPLIEMGWLPYGHQVGQTGKTVRPKLYIALGISGAAQHLAGMQNSETILAVNKDPQAPIFKVADLGIVGDVMEVVPELIKAVKQVKKRSPSGVDNG